MERKRNSILRCFSPVILCLLFVLCGCDGTSKEKIYSYADLSESQKSEIDFIMSKADAWSNDTIDRILFSSNVGTMRVDTFEKYGINQQEWYGWQIRYEYDLNKKTFAEDSKTYVSYASRALSKEGNGLTDGSVHSKEWSAQWSVEEKRDYLSNRLAKARTTG